MVANPNMGTEVLFGWGRGEPNRVLSLKHAHLCGSAKLAKVYKLAVFTQTEKWILDQVMKYVWSQVHFWIFKLLARVWLWVCSPQTDRIPDFTWAQQASIVFVFILTSDWSQYSPETLVLSVILQCLFLFSSLHFQLKYISPPFNAPKGDNYIVHCSGLWHLHNSLL